MSGEFTSTLIFSMTGQQRPYKNFCFIPNNRKCRIYIEDMTINA